MTTVVNNPGPERTVERVIETDSGAGWAVAVIILLVVVIAGWYYWTHHQAAAPQGGTNINVTLPTGTNNNGAAQ